MAGPVTPSARPGVMVLDALARTGALRPRVCLVLTASGDDVAYYAGMFEAFSAVGCDVVPLRLFPQPSADPAQRLAGSDLVWVGGGSVANLLALWRLHGVDTALREAHAHGTILAGVSAGSVCWHAGGTTDSFGPTLRPVLDGLGLVPFGNGVHYDSEPQRRPLLHRLVGEGILPAIAYATDDHIGIWYEGAEATEVVSDGGFDATLPASPAAYVVERSGTAVSETRLPVGPVR